MSVEKLDFFLITLELGLEGKIHMLVFLCVCLPVSSLETLSSDT